LFSLVPRTELRDLDRLRGEVDSLFDRFLDWRPFWRAGGDGEWMPSVDVSETTKEIVVHVEIPGMDPKDIDVSLNGNVLNLRGERKHEHEEKDENVHRIERRYGAFSRTIQLPADVDEDKVNANYKDGVLKLNLPKTKEASAKKIEVKAS
jgi:HSP20 family protein